MGVKCFTQSLLLLLLLQARLRVQAQGGCGATFDLTLVIDSSGSIKDNNPEDGSYDNWNLTLTFLTKLVDRLDISSSETEGVRVAAVAFSNDASTEFFFHTERGALQQDILDTEHRNGHTNTSGALRIMTDDIFGMKDRTNFLGLQGTTDRKNIRDVTLVVTDGFSNIDENRTIMDATAAKDQDITMFVIGITHKVNVEEIRNISSDPQTENVTYWLLPDFLQLEPVVEDIAKQICSQVNQTDSKSELTTTPVVSQTDCGATFDLTLVIDSSGSIRDNNPADGSYDNWILTLTFLSKLVDQLDITSSETKGVRVAAVAYSDDASIEFFFHSERGALQQDILDTEHRNGHTNTSGALRIMTDDIFGMKDRTNFLGLQGTTDRKNIRDVTLVVTDGFSNIDENRTIMDATAAKDQDITMFVIGITHKVNVEEIRNISSDPQTENVTYWLLPDFLQLDAVVEDITKQICLQVNQTDPKPDPTPTSDVLVPPASIIGDDKFVIAIGVLAALIFLLLLLILILCCCFKNIPCCAGGCGDVKCCSNEVFCCCGSVFCCACCAQLLLCCCWCMCWGHSHDTKVVPAEAVIIGPEHMTKGTNTSVVSMKDASHSPIPQPKRQPPETKIIHKCGRCKREMDKCVCQWDATPPKDDTQHSEKGTNTTVVYVKPNPIPLPPLPETKTITVCAKCMKEVALCVCSRDQVVLVQTPEMRPVHVPHPQPTQPHPQPTQPHPQPTQPHPLPALPYPAAYHGATVCTQCMHRSIREGHCEICAQLNRHVTVQTDTNQHHSATVCTQCMHRSIKEGHCEICAQLNGRLTVETDTNKMHSSRNDEKLASQYEAFLRFTEEQEERKKTELNRSSSFRTHLSLNKYDSHERCSTRIFMVSEGQKGERSGVEGDTTDKNYVYLPIDCPTRMTKEMSQRLKTDFTATMTAKK